VLAEDQMALGTIKSELLDYDQWIFLGIHLSRQQGLAQINDSGYGCVGPKGAKIVFDNMTWGNSELEALQIADIENGLQAGGEVPIAMLEVCSWKADDSFRS
jgi:hypothetical protein